MDSLVDPLTRDHPEDRVALRAPGTPPAEYRYPELVETVWKTGNYFRRLGTHEDAVVAIAEHHSAAVPLSVFGAALNGATVRLDPPSTVDAKLLVAPGSEVDRFDLPPGAQRVVHSESVDDPEVHSFGEGVWSENPIFPEDRVFVESAAIADGEREFDHADVVTRVTDLEDRVDAGDGVVIRAAVEDARVVLAGIVLPIYLGASVRIASDESSVDGSDSESVAVAATDEVPEIRVIRLDDV